MSHTLFVITRLVAIFLVVRNSILHVLTYGFGWKCFVFFLTLIVFLIISRLYEEKRRVFSPGYLLYFIASFIDYNVCAFTLYYNSLARENPKLSYINDYYSLYWSVFVIVSICIFIYLVKLKKISKDRLRFKVQTSLPEARSILITMLFVCIPLSFVLGDSGKLVLLFSSLYFLISFLKSNIGRKNIVMKIGFLISILVVISTVTKRFIFLEFVLPLLLYFIIYHSMSYFSEKFNYKILLRFMIVIGVGMLYGVASELVKLNLYYNGSYTWANAVEIFSNVDLLYKWFARQSYRIFDIWVHLGGNIIEYVDTHGFFYGLSYVKVFSEIFGYEYVNLPQLSAEMIGASYAQPGIIAEGYANFGFMGALINILVIFFVTELFFDLFLRKQNMFTLTLFVGSFSQVLLDGGTLNSILFLCIVCCVTFGIAWVIRYSLSFLEFKRYNLSL